MNNSRLGFLFFASIVFLFEVILLIFYIRSNSQYKRILFFNIIISIIFVPLYTYSIFTTSYFKSLLVKTLYYIGCDLALVYLLNFSQVYIYYYKQTYRSLINAIFDAIILIDIFLLIYNLHNPVIFTVEYLDGVVGYPWKINYKAGSIYHFVLLFILIITSLVTFILGYIKNPVQYKGRYTGIIITYFIVFSANFICYALNCSYDFSVLLFGLFFEFIFYYSNFIVPHNLLIQSLRNLNSTVDDGIIYFDNNGKIVYINNSAYDLFIENEIFTNETLELFRKDKITELDEGIKNVKLTWNQDFKVFNENRHIYFEYENVIYENATIGSYLLARDKTDEYDKFVKELYINTHDSLTNIYNEEKFYQVCNDILKNDPKTEKLMLISNIRDFKLINELYGQESGDIVLKKHAEILKKVVNDETTVFGRLGDDKFAMMLKKSNFHEQRFLTYIEQIRNIFGNDYTQIILQIGICEINNISDSAEVLVNKAKIAISMGNNNLKQTFFYYDKNLMEKILLEKNILDEFKNAILYNQISINLQPIVDINKNIVGAEALSRWYNPERGLLYPEKFIHILENNSIIQNLDLFVWESMAKLAAGWKREVKELPLISVNISDKDVYYIDLYKVFTKLINEYKLPPEKFVLEFKETSIVNNIDKISNLFVNLRNFGFKIAIDNYGTGYSSLNFLKNIQVDILKVDMIFLSENENYERSKIIFQFLSDMAKELNISVVFEGVEKIEQINLIKNFEKVYMQGYYFSNPVDISIFEKKFFKE